MWEVTLIIKLSVGRINVDWKIKNFLETRCLSDVYRKLLCYSKCLEQFIFFPTKINCLTRQVQWACFSYLHLLCFILFCCTSRFSLLCFSYLTFWICHWLILLMLQVLPDNFLTILLIFDNFPLAGAL